MIPVDFLSERFTEAHASVLFLATLNPAEYYQDLLDLLDNNLWITTPGPFSSTQLELRIVNLSTRFIHRAASITPMLERIEGQYRSAPNNYLVYLSRFTYLDQLTTAFEKTCPDIPTVIQLSSMQESDRMTFIQ